MLSFKKKELISETKTIEEYFLAQNWVGKSKGAVIEEMTNKFPFIRYVIYLLRSDNTAILFDDEGFIVCKDSTKFVFDNSWMCVKVEFSNKSIHM